MKTFFNRGKLLKEAQLHVSVLTEANKKQAERITELEQQLIDVKAQHEALKAEHPDMKAEGVLEPWFIIQVRGENALKGLEVSFDWNEAIIQHMRDKGYKEYRNEDLMIQSFIAQLYEHVITALDKNMIETADHERPNDFE